MKKTILKDPIQAKKRIKEALSILQMLNVPKEQQNDRSALTLLALVNVRATTPWSEATDISGRNYRDDGLL